MEIPFDETVEKEDTDLPLPLALPRLQLLRPLEWVDETDDARDPDADPDPDAEAEPELDAAVDLVPSRNRRLGGRSISARVGLGADTEPAELPDDRECE